jgi:GNAT superfamily N-acetyltransferase
MAFSFPRVKVPEVFAKANSGWRERLFKADKEFAKRPTGVVRFVKLGDSGMYREWMRRFYSTLSETDLQKRFGRVVTAEQALDLVKGLRHFGLMHHFEFRSELVAVADIVPEDGELGIAVHPKYRKLGYGGFLLDEIRKVYPDTIRVCVYDTNVHMIRFARKHQLPLEII